MITKQMSIGEVLRIDRNTAPIFMQYGMHCLGCPHATSESIEQAGMVHGVDVDQLVTDLNALLEQKAN
jgi:hybrid cluster-associated redox disulfide protein